MLPQSQIIIFLTLNLLALSADKLYKQFGPKYIQNDYHFHETIQMANSMQNYPAYR